MSLPSPRPSAGPGDPYRIRVVCLGNICRSPIAHVVLQDRLEAAGLADRVTVTSAGTGDWHVGQPMDPRSADTLAAAGYDPSRHRGSQFTAADAGTDDLVLAMDARNREDLEALGVGPQLRMFRDFDPEGPGDLPDPYTGGQAGFDRALAVAERTADALVAELARSFSDARADTHVVES
jgi:protein-tyrosine phosphatase